MIVQVYVHGRKKPVINTTSAYKNFIATLTESFKSLEPVQGKAIALVYYMIPPMRDADACIKPIFDALEKSGAVLNDRNICGYIVDGTRTSKGENGILFVKVVPYGAILKRVMMEIAPEFSEIVEE